MPKENPRKIKETTKKKPDKKASKNKNKTIAICKSKQLSSKLAAKSVRTSTSNNKPNLSLADLEKMFADDSSPENSPVLPKRVNSTPKIDPVIVDIDSPTQISNRVLEFFDTIIIQDTEEAPLPIIPPRKRKKNDIPYIERTKFEPQMSGISKAVVGRGDTDYGIKIDSCHSSDEEDNDDICPKKRSKISNPNHSLFNLNSELIAESLKYKDKLMKTSNSLESNRPISNMVGDNVLNNSFENEVIISASIGARFSPLPSTSKDNETFEINDKRYQNSLKINLQCSNTRELDQIEAVPYPDEIQCVDDYVSTNLCRDMSPEIVEINEKPIEIYDNLNDECSIVDKDKETNNLIDTNTIDEYDVIDLDNPLDFNKDLIDDVIDVDSIIAENQSIINKFKIKSDIGVITCVDSSNIPCTVSSPIIASNNINSDVQVENIIAENQEVINKFNILSDVSLVTNESPILQINPGQTKNNNMQVLKSVSKSSTSNDTSALKVAFEAIYNTLLGSCRMNSSYKSQDAAVSLKSLEELKSSLTDNSVIENVQHNLGVVQCMNAASPQKNSSDMNTSNSKKNIGDCPICMDNLSSSSSVASTICGHLFCMECIKRAMATNGKKCPTCRKPLKKNAYHAIFL